jgi:RNA polymerase sigma-70 factor (ECF subfamily)
MRSDEELMRAYKRGDAAALRELFERYAPILLGFLARGLHEREMARDLVQQTFVQVHRARFDFDESRRFRPWLFTIALNLRREYFRARRRRPELLAGDLLSELGGGPAGQEWVDARRSVVWALERIPSDQREVIELHWFEGLSFPEVAQYLGIGVAAAKVRAHRGYNHLRGLLSHGPGPEKGGNRRSGGGT